MCQGMGFVWGFSGSDNLELGKPKAVKLWLQGTVSLQRMVSDGLSLISCSSDAAALVGSGQQTHRACVSLCLLRVLFATGCPLWVNMIQAPALPFPFFPLPLKAGSISVLSE